MKMGDFSGKTAIVTGASRGIGKAIALTLLEQGCEVIITSTCFDSSRWRLKYKKCSHMILDFFSPRSVDEFCENAESLSGIDILINNAGIQIPEPIDTLKQEGWDKVLGVNLYGPMRLTRWATGKMKKSKKGRILNISSISGIVSKQCSAAYSASKSGLLGLTKAAALDLAPYGILVNALCPGYTQTEMMDAVSLKKQQIFKESIPLGRFAMAGEIAVFAAFLCSDMNTYITGQTIVVDGGVTIQ